MENKKNPKKVSAGKRSRAQGKAFELRVRKDLIEKGWIVDKWNNNVECTTYNKETGRDPEDWGVCKLIPAKAKWAGPGRPMMMGAGFCDFIAFKTIETIELEGGTFDEVKKGKYYEVIGVESKMTGVLDKLEKEKCKWLLENNIFSKILIAEKTKVKNRIVVKYTDFQEKYSGIDKLLPFELRFGRGDSIKI